MLKIGAGIIAVALVLGLLVSTGLSLSESSRAEFQNNPMLATFLPTLLPDREFGEVRKLKSLHETEIENTVPLPEIVIQRPDVSSIESSRKLVIVIPGIGGVATHGLNSVFSAPFVRRGYLALILPNPVSVSFGVHRLQKEERFNYRSSLDALCAAIEETISDKENRIEATKQSDVVIAGYSLGARYATSLNDCIHHQFPQARLTVSTVNPPIDFNFAVETLDRYATAARANEFLVYRAGARIAWAKMLSTSSQMLKQSARTGDFVLLLAPDLKVLPELVASAFLTGLEAVRNGMPRKFYQLVPSSQTQFASFFSGEGLSKSQFEAEIQKTGKNDTVTVLLTVDDFLVREADVRDFMRLNGRPNISISVANHGGHVGILFDEAYDRFVAQSVR